MSNRQQLGSTIGQSITEISGFINETNNAKRQISDEGKISDLNDDVRSLTKKVDILTDYLLRLGQPGQPVNLEQMREDYQEVAQQANELMERIRGIVGS